MSGESSAEIVRRLGEKKSRPASKHLRIESRRPEKWATRIFLGDTELAGIISKVEFVLDWNDHGDEYNTVVLHVIPESLGINVEAIVKLKEAVMPAAEPEEPA